MSDISVRYQDRITIPEFTPVEQANKSTDLLDSSYNTRSYQLPISALYSENGILVTDAAARRYHTDDNELSATDLSLFVDYEQISTPGRESQKNVYFEKFPLVDAPKNIYELASDQLMTKGNIPDFQEYTVRKPMSHYSSIPASNWENETESVHVKSFINFISKTRHDARATYKIMFDDTDVNPERVSNIVSLSKIKDPDSTDDNKRSISAAVHYSVAGIVSVKSNLDDQRSGTIYLEARKTGSDDDWQTIDSAVFKFISKKDWNNRTNVSPGTYVTLSGYLYTDFETRLKINLHPHAYSMNLNDYRDSNYALTNHYSNTFIGFIDIPNYKSESNTSINFSNMNYAGYVYGKNAIKFLTLSQSRDNEYPKVSALLEQFETGLKDSTLEISTKIPGLITHITGFEISGLRLSPMGKVYTMNETIPVEGGMTVYPAYKAGKVQTPRMATDKSFVSSYGRGVEWQDSLVLNRINYSELSVISGLRWPANTDICGNISMEISAKNTEYNTTTVDGVGGTYSSRLKSSRVYTTFARSVATENPRVQYQIAKSSISITPNGTLVGDITCHITATPNTSGPGDGNESYGRIYKINSNGSRSIIKEQTLNTKNVSVKMTDGLCTGSRWNIHEKRITADIIMPHNAAHRIDIEAAADTAADDGRKETIFTVNVSASFDYYVQTFIPNPPTTAQITNIVFGKGNCTNKMDCSVLYDKYAYADRVISSRVIEDSSKKLTDFNVQELSVTKLNFTNVGSGLTELSVAPHPQSVLF